ncbi:LysR family transcriptional regulator (plasmid) [Thioclava sp. 'Guangxiensis']|uniref:LysR family transcriptional regulator n=1 Tax=Thioclava sp. 'Guangxiensis' TaxID=3149044 RepID=UPI0032C3F672
MDSLRRKLPSVGSLFIFEAAARHQNFSRAADELNVTQPAISRAIHALETHLGQPLFERSRSGATLSAEGARLAQVVGRSFSDISAELDRLTRKRDEDRVITLSVSTAFVAHWLMPRISVFRAAFPQLELRFQLIAGPVSGPIEGVDLAMRYYESPPDGARVLLREGYIDICAASIARTARHGTVPRVYLEGISDPASIITPEESDRTSALSFADYSIVVQAALSGQGTATGWLNIVAHWLDTGLLVPVYPEPVMLTSRLCCLQFNETSARSRAVADWIEGQMMADFKSLSAKYPELKLERMMISPARA